MPAGAGVSLDIETVYVHNALAYYTQLEQPLDSENMQTSAPNARRNARSSAEILRPDNSPSCPVRLTGCSKR